MTTAAILAELSRLPPADLAQVQATLNDLAEPNRSPSVIAHPALGIWKDRADLPDDPTDASTLLRRRMMHRDDAATDPVAP